MEPPIVELKTPWPLVNVEEKHGELVVSFHPEAFLWPSVEEMALNLFSLVEETDGDEFVLDFGNVDYLTGVGVEKLVHLNKKLRSNGRRLVIQNVSPDLAKILALCKLANEVVASYQSTGG
jgi:anti-anti-sigma factor